MQCSGFSRHICFILFDMLVSLLDLDPDIKYFPQLYNRPAFTRMWTIGTKPVVHCISAVQQPGPVERCAVCRYLSVHTLPIYLLTLAITIMF